MIIDLRSDTVTKPTSAMIAAMMKAEVGDDVYKEDPTVNALEDELATMFGRERALFFPSGTMANQAAIKLHTQPGDQLIADAFAHVYNYEGGGVSFNSGVSCRLIEGDRGMLTAAQVESHINPPDFYHSPLTRLVCVENTTNKGGGACYSLAVLQEIREVCASHGLKYHLDGARLWNAMVATNTSAAQYGVMFDTISVCLSKGLGAPMGSVLIGDAVTIEKAIRVRKMLGGGMRQLGYMAAAGLYAIRHHVSRLEDDHRRAQEIGQVLSGLPFVIRVAPIDTNIVIFAIDGDEQEFLAKMAAKGVQFYSLGKGRLRLVTHLDYTEEMHSCFLQLLRSLV